MALTATTNSSSQTTTGSPQAASESSGDASAQSGRVQPGTAASLLNSTSGIQLHGTQLSTISLSPVATGASVSAAQAQTPKPTSKHHVNTSFLGVSALFIVVAVILMFVAKRSVKITT